MRKVHTTQILSKLRASPRFPFKSADVNSNDGDSRYVGNWIPASSRREDYFLAVCHAQATMCPTGPTGRMTQELTRQTPTARTPSRTQQKPWFPYNPADANSEDEFSDHEAEVRHQRHSHTW